MTGDINTSGSAHELYPGTISPRNIWTARKVSDVLRSGSDALPDAQQVPFGMQRVRDEWGVDCLAWERTLSSTRGDDACLWSSTAQET